MGPLHSVRIVEFAGIGPGPLCATLLADMGAEVIRIDRVTPSGLGIATQPRYQTAHRARPSIALDMKRAEGVALALDLIANADGLIEGFRPGVMERLGVGPETCLERNPKLVFGRITGWGQDGPLSQSAGHDINYIALAGVLDRIGSKDGPPLPPLNLVGDYGGGAMFLAVGMLAGLLEASRCGAGQVVDAAMFEGAAYLMLPLFGWMAAGMWRAHRGDNILDGGSPWYNSYQCADGRWVSIGAIEPKFYQQLLKVLGLDGAELPEQNDRSAWPVLQRRFAEVFKSESRDTWCQRFEGVDACFAPVLTPSEVHHHPHHTARGSMIELDGVVQPAPAPRFSRSVSPPPSPPRPTGHGGREALKAWGVNESRIDELKTSGVLAAN